MITYMLMFCAIQVFQPTNNTEYDLGDDLGCGKYIKPSLRQP